MRQRPIHQAQRAVSQITLGVASGLRDREQRIAELGLRESYQQYQLPISGTAGTLPGFATITLTFDFPFHYAPGQRDSDLERPHLVGFGAEVDSDVMAGATVRSWLVDPATGGYTGATVEVWTMSAIEFQAFTGTMHLTFQGFSAPDDVNDIPVSEA